MTGQIWSDKILIMLHLFVVSYVDWLTRICTYCQVHNCISFKNKRGTELWLVMNNEYNECDYHSCVPVS